MAAIVPDVERALKETVHEMGLEELKPKQTEADLAVASGRDTFVSLPTGYGKSIIYRVYLASLIGLKINSYSC